MENMKIKEEYEHDEYYSECYDKYNNSVLLNDINIEEVDYFEIVDDEYIVNIKDEPNIINNEDNVRIKEENISMDDGSFFNTEINKFNFISDTNVMSDQPKYKLSESVQIELVPVNIPRKELYSIKKKKISMSDDDDDDVITNEALIRQDNVNNIDIHTNYENSLKTNHVLYFNNKYKCDVCSKEFTQSCNLKKHMYIHSGTKQYKCDICCKEFTESSNLKKHMDIHSGTKQYKCDVCSKECTQYSNLKKHMYIHSGTKQYKCDVCSKECTQSSNLKKHMYIHSGTKQHKCDVCSKEFIQKYQLKKHMYIHSGTRQHK